MTPKRVVGLVATIVVLLLVYGKDVHRAIVGDDPPRISFERGARAPDGEGRGQAVQPPAQAAVFGGEVYRTEGRLREASAMVVAATLSGIGRITERSSPVRTVEELQEEIVRRGLLPPGVELSRERSLLVSEHSTIHLRFRPTPFGVEVVSLGRERADGPGLLIRVPDENGASRIARQRYFYSFRLENISVPEAFANASAIEAAGWQVEYLDARLPEGTNAVRLAAWARQQQQQRSQSR
jgi:hypothetical protein